MRISEAVLMAVALGGPLRTGAITRQCALWGAWTEGNNVAVAVYRLVGLEQLRGTRDGYTLGPQAPAWARLLATADEATRQGWAEQVGHAATTT